jgi:hypothetical protein
MFGEFVGAFTASTAIAAFIAALSLWGCIAERHNKTLVWKLSLAIGLLSVAAVVFSIKDELAAQESDRISQSQILAAQGAAASALEKLAGSEKRVEELLGLNRAISRKLDSRADVFTPEVRERLASRLKSLPPKSISIMRIDPTGESRELAGVLALLLTNAGCLGGDMEFVDSGMNWHAAGRLVVRPPNTIPEEPTAKSLYNLLLDVGLDVTYDTTRSPINTGWQTQLIVKPK